jgi:RimJ/RimL family protein N-acetyltransferase
MLPMKTPRLNLRQLVTEDLPDLLEFIMDEQSYEYLEGYPPYETDVQNWLERNRVPRFSDGDAIIPLGVELPKAPKIIGYVSLRIYGPQDHRYAEFDMMISRHYRSRGYGTEALESLVAFALKNLRLEGVYAGMDSRNLAARRMTEKAGLRLEEECVHDRQVKGVPVNTAWYVLHREEYERQMIPVASA